MIVGVNLGHFLPRIGEEQALWLDLSVMLPLEGLPTLRSRTQLDAGEVCTHSSALEFLVNKLPSDGHLPSHPGLLSGRKFTGHNYQGRWAL